MCVIREDVCQCFYWTIFPTSEGSLYLHYNTFLCNSGIGILSWYIPITWQLRKMMGYQNSFPNEYTNRSDWMSQLPDSTRMKSLTIPGTHQTMARYGLGKCQHRSIADQYEMGIRFVDIGCRWLGDALPIHNGRWFQQEDFLGVVWTTVGFLRDHPRETILMLVKDEHHKTVKGHLNFSQLVWLTFMDEDASVLHNVPDTLGEARGRIILFHKDWQENDCQLGTALCHYFDVHDDWKEHDGDKRWESAKKHLDKTAGNNSPILTYVSGYKNRLFGLIPDTYAMANHLHLMLGSYVRSRESCRLGVVLFDMAPDDIVGGLIKCNTKGSRGKRMSKEHLCENIWATVYNIWCPYQQHLRRQDRSGLLMCCSIVPNK